MRPEAGIKAWICLVALDTSCFLWGWMGGRERSMLESSLHYLLLSFPVFDRKKQAQRTCELLRVP